MTSATILPSVGPPPPNIRRPHVPEELKPKIKDPVEELSSAGQKHARAKQVSEKKPQTAPVQDGQPNAQGRTALTGRNAAVLVQVQEGAQVRPPVTEEVANEIADAENPPVEDQRAPGQLDPEDQAYVQELKARDREVRAHEAAHATAGAGYAGAPNFEYVRGPDGISYAVGGHVSIDTGAVSGDPRATIAKMDVVRRAALAPARPSGQDRAVAAAAEQAQRQAQGELNAQRAEEAAAQRGEGTEGASGGPFAAVQQTGDTADAFGATTGPSNAVSTVLPKQQQFAGIDLIA